MEEQISKCTPSPLSLYHCYAILCIDYMAKTQEDYFLFSPVYVYIAELHYRIFLGKMFGHTTD